MFNNMTRLCYCALAISVINLLYEIISICIGHEKPGEFVPITDINSKCHDIKGKA